MLEAGKYNEADAFYHSVEDDIGEIENQFLSAVRTPSVVEGVENTTITPGALGPQFAFIDLAQQPTQLVYLLSRQG